MERPHVTYDQRLKDYMQRKGYRHIAVEHVTCTGCCVDLAEVVTRFVDDKTAEEIRAKGCVVLEGDIGDVLVARGMDYDPEISMGLTSFFGAKDITVKGIRSWTF